MCQNESGAKESDTEDIQSGKRVTFSLFDVSWDLQFLLTEVNAYRQSDRVALLLVKISEDKFMLALWWYIPTYKMCNCTYSASKIKK